MKSVYSSTGDSKYDYFIPISAWCWQKLNVGSIVFVPENKSETLKYAMHFASDLVDDIKYHAVVSEKHKEATFIQCVRLYGACLDLPEDEILIVGDVDMLNFKVPPYVNNGFTVWGSDLVPNKQLPMCYVSASVKDWRNNFCKGMTYQQCLDDLVGVIECEHFRGNQWSLDQSELYKNIAQTTSTLNLIPRARQGTQFAANRVDRDDINWRAYVNDDLVDAHLWRPGYSDENFKNIMELLTMKYPNEDFTWLTEYTKKYRELL